MLLDRDDPGDGWLLPRRKGLSWLLLAFISWCYLKLHKSTGALHQMGEGCKSNLALGLKMSFTADLTILIWFVCFLGL